MTDDLMTLATLADLCRKKQRAYFQSRQPSLLNECRDLEKRLDRLLDSILRPETPGLFDRSGP